MKSFLNRACLSANRITPDSSHMPTPLSLEFSNFNDKSGLNKTKTIFTLQSLNVYVISYSLTTIFFWGEKIKKGE